MRKYLCWLLGHNYICLLRHHWRHCDSTSGLGGEYTVWVCQHCGRQRTEQWDS